MIIILPQIHNKKRTLIVGAGSAGTMVARQLLKNNDVDLYPTAFVDDDPTKHKLQIYGIEVKGNSEDIPRVVEECKIDRDRHCDSFVRQSRN